MKLQLFFLFNLFTTQLSCPLKHIRNFPFRNGGTHLVCIKTREENQGPNSHTFPPSRHHSVSYSRKIILHFISNIRLLNPIILKPVEIENIYYVTRSFKQTAIRDIKTPSCQYIRESSGLVWTCLHLILSPL